MRRVLLLNITYEPLTTVGLHRAVCLVLGDKAEIVHDDAGGRCCTPPRSRLAAPSVIRLRRYVRIPHRSRVPLTRAALMRRDNYLCAYCGVKADTIDHVIPRSRGGLHAWENCVASCNTVQPPQGRPPGRGTRLDAALRPGRAARRALAADRRRA